MKKQAPFLANIEKQTLENDYFRHVLFTAPHSQVVLMSLLPGEDIGVEVHHVDQFFRVEAGKGKAIVDDVEYELADGTALLVCAGSEHNIVNTGKKSLKLYTIYAPANHIDGRIHKNKAEALADEEDEAFGPKI